METAEVKFGDLFDTHEHILLLLGDGDSSDLTYTALDRIATDVNEGGDAGAGKRRLGVVYVGWMLYNDSCDHGPLGRKSHSLPGDLSAQLKTNLPKLTSDGVNAPHALVLGRDRE